MTLRLVGAGLPRTGTSSLREALRDLLGAPVYHMSEVLDRPDHAATWVAALDGRAPDWSRFLAGYAAGVDVPFASCWRELAATFPDAPVLLSHRSDRETWYRSMAATVLPRTRDLAARTDDPLAPLFRRLFRDVFTDPDDPEDVMAGHDRWQAEVRRLVPPGRLVEWQPGDGWEPLCRALDLPVPDRPFPHENSTAEHVARSRLRAARDEERAAAARDRLSGPRARDRRR